LELNKELIVNVDAKGVEIALLEDKKLIEFHREKTDNQFNVGDIYLGKVTKLMPSLNAAFVEVGHEKEAFLHYTDLGPNVRSLMKFTNSVINGQDLKNLNGFNLEAEIVKTGKVNQVLQSKQSILVQILKEPINTKGPRLNAEISLPGRFLVLTPFTNHVSISKKIAAREERQRLTNIIDSIRPENFGVILRTAAENKNTAELHQDMLQLMSKWAAMVGELKSATPPKKVASELDKTSSILRDLLNDSFNRIVVNDKSVQQDIKAYISRIAPGKENIVQLHNAGMSIFDANGVTVQIKASFGKQVSLPSGGSLIIEKTEALHVIDVNSGHNMGSGNKDHEENLLKLNTEAALEVARQLRLRDMGGIIIIDFIDMRNPKSRVALFNSIKDAMKNDRAKHTILPPSKFGLMQLTRQRVRPEIEIVTTEVCPTCNGTGKIAASILVIDDIEKALHNLLVEQNHSKINLVVHPFVESYLKRGFISKNWQWMMKYKKMINILSDANLPLTSFRLLDKSKEEITF
jgi:ribonuclease G